MKYYGYNLWEGGPDEWLIEDCNPGGIVFGGSFKEVIIYAIVRLGFNVDELDTAVQDMIHEEHHRAHFGMGRYFMFSDNKELPFDDKRKAS